MAQGLLVEAQAAQLIIPHSPVTRVDRAVWVSGASKYPH